MLGTPRVLMLSSSFSSSSLQEVQESLQGDGVDIPTDVHLGAEAFLLPAGCEAKLHVRGGAGGGETNHRPQNATAESPAGEEKEKDEDQGQDSIITQYRREQSRQRSGVT